MISISRLFEKAYEPWMVGTARHVGGPGYPTADLRQTKPPPSQLMAQQKRMENLDKSQLVDMIRQMRGKKNPTQAERMQGAV